MSDITIEQNAPAQATETGQVPPLVPTPPAEPETPMVECLAQEILILNDHVRVKLNGGVEKAMSLSDFRSILDSTLGHVERSNLEGVTLPSNVFYFARSATEIILSSYFPTRIAQIQYLTKKMTIVVPNVIISHRLSKTGDKIWTRAEHPRYFCTDLPVSRMPQKAIFGTDKQARIFLFPFSNTYAEGTMCYGGNSMPTRFEGNNLRSLDWYYMYLFESPFNDDLGIKATGNKFTPSSWYNLLSGAAKESKPFPYEHLTGYTPL